jgi:DNA-directed RNA polymerase subunit RPC12/RpoP
MIDSFMNLLFRCSHRRLTRPVAPITKPGQPHSQSYVVCLDCGKQFEYDLSQMRMGKAIDRSHEAGVVPPDMPTPRKRKVGYALLAAVPAAVVLGAVLTGKKKATKPEGGNSNPAAKDESGQGKGEVGTRVVPEQNKT